MELTQELVRNTFDYKDGVLYWKIISSNYKKNPGDEAGYFSTKRHERRRKVYLNSKVFIASRIIFLWHYGYLPENVDHIDRNCGNDRIENLRAASRIQNAQNRTSMRNSSSQYLGVYKFKSSNSTCWRSQIRIDGKNVYLGLFKIEEKAALAYNSAAVKYRGEFANLNIIKPLAAPALAVVD